MALVERQIVVALVSGSGSTAFEIYKATQDGRLPHTKLGMVISSKPEAGSYDRFMESDFPWDRYAIVRPEDHETPEQYGEALVRTAKLVSPDIIGQYGHTPLTPENVIAEFPNRMINQHPGPVDPSSHDFGGNGMSSADRVHAARLIFVRETGRNFWTDVTAQRVSRIFDAGKVIKRERVPILPEDTVAILKERAKKAEYTAQIGALNDFEEDRVEELPSYEDLVLRHEVPLLQMIKRYVKHLYPPEK